MSVIISLNRDNANVREAGKASATGSFSFLAHLKSKSKKCILFSNCLSSGFPRLKCWDKGSNSSSLGNSGDASRRTGEWQRRKGDSAGYLWNQLQKGFLWKFLETMQKSVTELSLLRVEGALIFMYQLLRITPVKFPRIGNTPLRYRALRHRDVGPGSWKSAGGYLRSTGYEQGPDNICYSH